MNKFFKMLCFEFKNGKKSSTPGSSGPLDDAPRKIIEIHCDIQTALQQGSIFNVSAGGKGKTLRAVVRVIKYTNTIGKVVDDTENRFWLIKNGDGKIRLVDRESNSLCRLLSIQIPTSFNLDSIVNIKQNNIMIKQHIVTTLLTAMGKHNYNNSSTTNGCNAWYILIINNCYMLFEFDRLIQMLLRVISNSDYEDCVQQTGVKLLCSISYELNSKRKNELGNTGIINKIMAVIKDRIYRKVFDEVHLNAWITMINMTDDEPKNCKRFLDENGLKYVLACLVKFPNNYVLIKRVVGVMNNVAEIKVLRPRLMRVIKVFSDLLFLTDDGFEVSFDAAGIIAHLASDGYKAWNLKTSKRSEVLDLLAKAIRNWDLNSERLFVYRSFKPILQLARVRHTPECALWAVWALANLTKVYPEKYCSIVKAEDGLKIMGELLEDNFTLANKDCGTRVIHSLAQTVIDQCMLF